MNTAKPQISAIGLPKRASLNVTTSTMSARTIQLHAIERKAISKTDCIAIGRFDACKAGAENFRYATQCMAAATSSTMQPNVTNARDMLRRVIIRFGISSSGKTQSYLQNESEDAATARLSQWWRGKSHPINFVWDLPGAPSCLP